MIQNYTFEGYIELWLSEECEEWLWNWRLTVRRSSSWLSLVTCEVDGWLYLSFRHRWPSLCHYQGKLTSAAGDTRWWQILWSSPEGSLLSRRFQKGFYWFWWVQMIIEAVFRWVVTWKKISIRQIMLCHMGSRYLGALPEDFLDCRVKSEVINYTNKSISTSFVLSHQSYQCFKNKNFTKSTWKKRE